MTTAMTDDDRLRRIEEIIVENARLLDEDVRLGVRVRRDGVRVQVRLDGRWVRGQYRHYSNVLAALHAATEANREAKRWRAAIDDAGRSRRG
jgi:hypothetical protein